MRPLRVLTDYAITPRQVQAGGIEGSAEATVRGLRQQGLEVVPVRFRVMQSHDAPCVVRVTHEDLAWHEVRVPFETTDAFQAGDFSWRALDTQIVDCYVALLRDQAPDAVLINAFPWFQHYLSEAARVAGIPVVMLHHGFVYKELPFLQIPRAAQERVALWERAASEAAVREVFISSQSHQVWRHDNPAEDRERDIVVPLAIADIFFEPRLSDPRLVGERQIGWVGRWDSVKRPEYVAALSRALAGSCRMHAVTHIPTARAHEKDLFADDVQIHAPMDPVALKAFYGSLAACVLPSAFETLGKVVLEAAMCGVPTFITPTVSLADVYRETDMEDFLLVGTSIHEDAERIARVIGRPPTVAFVEYVQREHRSSVMYTRLAAVIAGAAHKRP